MNTREIEPTEIPRHESWKRIYDSHIHLKWAPFMVDLALDTSYGGSLENPTHEFLDQCRVRGAKYVPADFDWDSAASRHGLFDQFLTKQVFELLKRLGHTRSEFCDVEEYKSLIRTIVISDIPNYDPTRGHKKNVSGFTAFLFNFALQRARRPLSKLVFTAHIVHYHTQLESTTDRTILDVLEANQAEGFVTQPARITMGNFGCDEIIGFATDAVDNSISSDEDLSLFCLSVGAEMNVEESADLVGVSRTTAYRRIGAACDRAQAKMRNVIAKSLGSSPEDAAMELLGLLNGRETAKRRMPTAAMLSLLDPFPCNASR